MLTIVAVVAAVFVGACLGYFYSQKELKGALESKARAEQDAQRVPQLEHDLAQSRIDNASLQSQVAVLNKNGETQQEKLQWIDRAQAELKTTFESLASQALKGNSENLLQRTQDKINPLFEGLEKNLKALDDQVRDMEQKREGAYKGMEEQLRQLFQTNQQMIDTTGKLALAFNSSSQVKGNWGELHLRRVVEMAGMIDHVDFETQSQGEGREDGEADSTIGKPDMIIRLPNDGFVPVDSKAFDTLRDTYLEAIQTSDPAQRKVKLENHANNVMDQVRSLGSKRYWELMLKKYPDLKAPELVVMFVPSEAAVAAAFEARPELLEDAMKQRVLLTTPVTLLALLKAVAFGWQQQQISENARQIGLKGKEFYDRLGVFIDLLADVGVSIDSTAFSYNKAIGSLDARLIPIIREMKKMGAGDAELNSPKLIEKRTRPIRKAEQLIEDRGDGESLS